MALTYTYSDAFLAGRVTEDREDRAQADIADMGTFPDEWVERLCILRAYIIVCTECMQSSDDTFSAKLAAYRKDYADTLGLARAAQQVADVEAGTAITGGGSLFSIDLQRG